MSDIKSLDDHLATINDILGDEGIASKLPDPPESVVHYRTPPGTFDGAMDLKPDIDMSKFAMPIFGQRERTETRYARPSGLPCIPQTWFSAVAVCPR
jgi:hypothetical protein